MHASREGAAPEPWVDARGACSPPFFTFSRGNRRGLEDQAHKAATRRPYHGEGDDQCVRSRASGRSAPWVCNSPALHTAAPLRPWWYMRAPERTGGDRKTLPPPLIVAFEGKGNPPGGWNLVRSDWRDRGKEPTGHLLGLLGPATLDLRRRWTPSTCRDPPGIRGAP
ncbi:hypothetical protein NDU88_005676 [Pleurodeles waltl]|uniref:Uncharacterized protein n=1 Tax=Pleurodeles waltl TaxID=8319 RepID=A0AAV7TBT1_PLEWA|nr:hypothetical protein NDU88_005676 [Pleurodeles waltl]